VECPEGLSSGKLLLQPKAPHDPASLWHNISARRSASFIRYIAIAIPQTFGSFVIFGSLKAPIVDIVALLSYLKHVEARTANGVQL
jgi:hypothetical protein